MAEYCVVTNVNGTLSLELRPKKSRSKYAVNIPNVNQIVESFQRKKYALIQFIDERFAFINEQGKSILEYDKVSSLKTDKINGYLVAKYVESIDSYLWGYLDEDLNELIPTEYAVRKKLHWGYCFYDFYNRNHDTIYILQKDGRVEKVR